MVERDLESQPGLSDTPLSNIVGVGASYGADVLRLSVSIQDYRERAGDTRFWVRTSQGVAYRISVSREEGDTTPRVQRSSRTSPGWRTSSCEGLSATSTARGVTLRVPTPCLGDAWKVRFGVRALVIVPRGEASFDHYRDQAFDDGAFYPPDGSVLGPWIAQG